MGGVWALELDTVAYKSLHNYLLDFVTYDKLLDSLSQDFLISKIVKNILSVKVLWWLGIKYQKCEMLCLIKEAQQLGIVVIKDFPQTSQQFSFFPYCKAHFLKILLKELFFQF